LIKARTRAQSRTADSSCSRLSGVITVIWVRVDLCGVLVGLFSTKGLGSKLPESSQQRKGYKPNPTAAGKADQGGTRAQKPIYFPFLMLTGQEKGVRGLLTIQRPQRDGLDISRAVYGGRSRGGSYEGWNLVVLSPFDPEAPNLPSVFDFRIRIATIRCLGIKF